jgi:hypothetical protein
VHGVGVSQFCGQRWGMVEVQVHGKEGQLRRDIAGAQPGTELDAIDNRDAFVKKVDMFAAQIPVPFTNMPGLQAVLQQLLMLSEEGVTKGADLVVLVLTQRVSDELSRFLKIIGEWLPNDLGGSIFSRLCGRGSVVESY